MAFGSLALAIAATLKTPMVETGVDTGKSRGSSIYRKDSPWIF